MLFRALALSALLLTACTSTPPSFTPLCDGGAGLTACGQECVALTTDARNCGACGTACEATSSCASSACYPNDCADADCAASQVCPAGVCIDKSCLGVVCPGGSTCYQGTCIAQSCAGLTCAGGDACVNGACRDVACEGVTCPAGRVCQAGTCAVGTCADALAGPGETDVDCGGACPTRCRLGAGCAVASDCESNSCTGNRCVAPNTCANRVKDGNETDVDCGGTCPSKCEVGSGCAVVADCASGVCSSLVCGQSATCTNSMRDGQETDSDCGGPSCAARCFVGRACLLGRDCVTSSCVMGGCAAATCSDGALNGFESDVDCGGSCASRCVPGKRCAVVGDCEGTLCTLNVCALPSCTDGLRNATEGDVDCGGGCALKCSAGRTCVAGTDCLSGTCMTGACTADPTCSDGIRNQGEVDVDCGAPCGPCVLGKMCTGPANCASFFCTGAGAKTCTTGFAAPLTTPVNNAGLFAVGRVNGDPYDDVVMLTQAGGPNGILSYVLGTSTGAPSPVVDLNEPAFGASDLVFTDLTGDGVSDILTGTGRGVRFLRGMGNGTFQAAVDSTLDMGGAAGRISVAQLTGSMAPDVIIPGGPETSPSHSPGLALFTGSGLGSFTGAFVQGPAFVSGTSIGDLDGDGMPEIIGSYANNTTIIYRAVGAALMPVGTPLPFGNGATTAIADVNGDGRNDILTVNGSLAVAINSNSGLSTPTFFPVVSYVGPNTDLFVRDFNRDGKLDVVTSSGGIVFFMGDGSGGFSRGPTLPYGGRFAVGDINADGKLDLITVTASNVVGVLLGL